MPNYYILGITHYDMVVRTIKPLRAKNIKHAIEKFLGTYKLKSVPNKHYVEFICLWRDRNKQNRKNYIHRYK